MIGFSRLAFRVFDALGTSTLRDSDLEVSRISCLELSSRGI